MRNERWSDVAFRRVSCDGRPRRAALPPAVRSATVRRCGCPRRGERNQAKDKGEEQKIARAEKKAARDAEAKGEAQRSEMHLVWATFDRRRT